MRRVGILGCGTLGGTLAARLLHRGWVTLVHDPDPARVAPVVNAGGVEAGSPARLAAEVDFLISALPRAEDVRGAFLGDGGALAALRPGSCILESSTVGPACVRGIAAAAAKRKIRYLDAPVTRGAVVDGRPTLTFLIGGHADHFDLARPALEAIADKLLYCGGVGDAQVAKLINNLVAHVITVAAGDALALGVRCGVSLDILCSTLHLGTGQNRIVDELLPGSVFRGDWAPGHRLDMALKELEAAGTLAGERGVPQTLFEPVFDLFREADAKGWGHLSAHAVVRLIEERRSVQLRSASCTRRTERDRTDR